MKDKIDKISKDLKDVKENLSDIDKRMTDVEKKVDNYSGSVSQLFDYISKKDFSGKAQLVRCPSCKNKFFSRSNKSRITCSDCGNKFPREENTIIVSEGKSDEKEETKKAR